MEDDAESRILRELAEIEEFKDKVGELQTDFEELSDRIDKIEILNIQRQLNSLHDSLLDTQRWVAKMGIHYSAKHILGNVRAQKPDMSSRAFTQLTANLSSALSKADVSTKPLDVLGDFHDKLAKYEKEWGLKLIDLS